MTIATATSCSALALLAKFSPHFALTVVRARICFRRAFCACARRSWQFLCASCPGPFFVTVHGLAA
eukprot:11225395-Alexandrium_andersonii.AAC.1